MENIAYENGLDVITTTSARNGYPQRLQRAIIGFDTFEDAEELADVYGLSIEIFTKYDGWNLWYRTGDHAWAPFERSAEEYGDEYRQYSKDDLDGFYEREVQPNVGAFDDFASLRTYLDSMEEIRDRIEDADDNEIVLASFGGYYDTIKKTTMSYCYDTHHFAIGLIDRENE
uniref:hypothetical protein n=1 Tax=Prevotella sp. TaxID=59823 RepID=UPI00402969D5